ncbi:sensor histidine kinase [Duganella callida]|uniref:Histidine kinase n=1 Tax=Duganella callida TaxID=2561932 RepID=A0A4Y9SIM6_9BURK|nr:sensor histidine kinase [Duganella callida]TFW20628.1 histidine kinase [Duganella callida]
MILTIPSTVIICRLLQRALATGLLLIHLLAGASAPAPLLSDYTHTAWTRLQNAPADVLKITQTTDGWLWVATATGLYRYDGVHFERVDSVYGHPLDSSNVIGLNADGKSGLWVGYRLGGIALFRPDGKHTFGEAEGFPLGGVIHIEAPADGSVWVGTRDGLAWLAAGAKRFQLLGGAVGLPEKFVYQVLIARDGTQWVGTLQGLFFRRPGQQRFTQAWPRVQLLAVAEGPDGAIWARDAHYRYFRVQTGAPPAGRPPQPAFPGMGMRFGADQTMWVLHPDGVERRFGADGASYPHQRLTRSSGMSGPQAQAFFEDREGSIWIGTASGLDRLRRNRLSAVTLEQPLEEPGVALGPRASILIGDRANGAVYRQSGRHWSRLNARGSITASYRGADDTAFFGTDAGIFALSPEGRLSLTPAPEEVRGFAPQAMLRDRRGVLWVSYSSGPLFRLAGGRWRRADEMPRYAGALTLAMASDDGGALWLAHANNTVTVTDDAGRPARQLNAAAGLDLGAVLLLTPDLDRMWLGGERGVMLYRQGRLRRLRGQGGEAFRGVSGLVRTPDGDLWLHGADGIFHISAGQIAGWLERPDAMPAFERFDARDGLEGHARQLRPIPSLLRGDDGRLWFSTSSAVFVLDPAHIARNRVAPPVLIRGVSTSRYALPVAVPARGVLRLPEGTDDLHIEFTALGMRMPERVRFRYRLLGVDAGWQGPVERREAFYTNLQPGSYRFEVGAANEDDVWYPALAAVDLEIPPTFVQSVWCRLLLVMLAAALLYGAHVLHLRALTQRMQARLSERARIARSLHDTLLQSIQGLILSFRAHYEMAPMDDKGRERLAHTLGMAEQLLVEGRNQIMDLRAPSTSSTLFDSLSEFGHTLTALGSHAFEARLHGTPRSLSARVYEDIYAIGREALFNAARYARAGMITLVVDYGRQEFQLAVHDDGCGLASEGERDSEAAHWGLQGILERARGMGADLQVRSEAGRGTRIALRIKKNLAYEATARGRRPDERGMGRR